MNPDGNARLARDISTRNCLSFHDHIFPSGTGAPLEAPRAREDDHGGLLLKALLPQGGRLVVGPDVARNVIVKVSPGSVNRLKDPTVHRKGYFVRCNEALAEKPSGANGGWCDKDMGCGNLLVEMDKAEWDAQLKFWTAAVHAGCPVVALTDSGGKSLHAIIRTGAATRDLHKIYAGQILKAFAPLLVDHTTANVSRLTRLPGFIRGETGRLQRLLYLNPSAPSWRDSGFEDTLDEWSMVAETLPEDQLKAIRKSQPRNCDGMTDAEEQKEFVRRREALGILNGIDMDGMAADEGWVLDRVEVDAGGRIEERTYVECPRSDRHTGGGTADGPRDAYIYNRKTSAVFPWGFHCSHDACRGVGMLELLEEIHEDDPERLRPYLKFSGDREFFEDLSAADDPQSVEGFLEPADSAKPASSTDPKSGHALSPPDMNWAPRPKTDIIPSAEAAMWEIFHEYIKGRAVYVTEWRQWAFWNGVRWVRDESTRIESIYLWFMQSRRARSASPELEAANEAWGSAKRMTAIGQLARSDVRVGVKASVFDQHPFLLGCRNGVLDLSTMEFRAARPSDFMTRQTACDWNPEAECPQFHQFLNTVTGGNQDEIGFLQRYFGYCLTASTSEQKMLFIQGNGSNGKTTLMDILRKTFGTYARQTASTLIMRTRNTNQGGPSPEIVTLRGIRLVTMDEADSQQEVDEVKTKQITGGEVLTGRNLFEGIQCFNSTSKILMGVNHLPRIRNNDDGIWRRIVLMTFEKSFNSAPDRGMNSKLEMEMEGILVWLVEGCRLWQLEGLNPPETVSCRTCRYRSEQDLFGQFLEDHIEFSPDQDGLRTRKGDVYEVYKSFSAENNSKPMAHNIFSQRMTERGGNSVKNDGVRYWTNIKLLGSEV